MVVVNSETTIVTVLDTFLVHNVSTSADVIMARGNMEGFHLKIFFSHRNLLIFKLATNKISENKIQRQTSTHFRCLCDDGWQGDYCHDIICQHGYPGK